MKLKTFGFASCFVLEISCFVFLSFAPHVFAQGFVPLAPIPGLTQGATADTAGLATFFNNLYKYLIGLAAILAVIMIIWGGIEISTQDSISKQGAGREKIKNAIFGLILVLSPVLVFSIINPSILNLSLNLPKLDTASSTPVGTGNGTGGTVNPATGCVVGGMSGILQLAICPSATSAQAWGQSCTNGDLSTTNVTNSANGVVTSIVTCADKPKYVFIDKGGTFISVVNRLQPLVSTADRPNNGSDAMSFANICRSANVGFQTCVSDTPGVTFSTPCQLTGANASTTWSCYNEKLTCESSSFVGAAKCSANPSWTPFQ